MTTIGKIVPILALLGIAGAVQASSGQSEALSQDPPAGMVAFFNRPTCPFGWTSAPETWNGRYVVMAPGGNGALVGTPLTPGENRATGGHTHSVERAFGGANNCSQDNRCARYGDSGFRQRATRSGPAVGEAGGPALPAGTNAPYVALKTCIKR